MKTYIFVNFCLLISLIIVIPSQGHKFPNAKDIDLLYKRSMKFANGYTPMSTYEKFVSANNYLRENEEHNDKRAPNAKLVQALKMFANRPSFENSFKFRGKSFVQPNPGNTKIHFGR